MNINHSWVLKGKHKLILYRVFFYFFNVSIAKVYQMRSTFNIEIFCTKEGMGLTHNDVRRKDLNDSPEIALNW